MPLARLEGEEGPETMMAGSTLKVIATDPGAMGDFGHFCEATGDSLLMVGRSRWRADLCDPGKRVHHEY